ncbi:hypothetical protein FRZ67_16915 [Panacibacter ginsenosidivorans]|uniref:DUF998 domain-containing protein n=1 Tax=Panacibacter ginsenosidivorans TaxID=1813871 RepID=A0A5B8VBL6_9BACT|nr:hypothetical protein [Panacibacter ginsenosidivorans]QEC68907.1 hypothetical protein FRZ67_16915 [Panacibacter ginsenosidivorans]
MSSQNDTLPALPRGWNFVEKAIAVILTISSVFVLYNEVSIIAGILTSGYTSKDGSTYLQLLKMHHLPVLISLIGLFGGSLLFFNDKKGWLLSLIATAMFGAIFYLSSKSNAANNMLPFASFYKSYGVTSIICFVFSIILLWKPFRKKYRPTIKNWLWLAGTLTLLIIDKIIL